MATANNNAKSKHDEKNWLEWLVFCISLLLLLGIIGYLVYQVLNYKPTDPDVYAEARLDPSGHTPNRYKVVVYNKGGTTAEALLAEFILYKAGKAPERSEFMVAFLPRNSESDGWVTFSGEPAPTDSVTARIVSYQKP